MSDRPVVIFRDGRLYLDYAGTYQPVSRMSVALLAQTQSTLRCPEAREIVRQCNEALKQYAATEESK